MSEQNSSSRQNGGGKNSPDFVTPSGSSRPPNQHSDVLDEGECIKLRQFNEAPPDAPDEQLLIDIFNEVQEYVAAEMAKRKRTKTSMGDLTSTEARSFFDHADIRYNSNEFFDIEPNHPTLRDAAEAQGIDSVTFEQGIDATDLTAPGISLQKKDAVHLKQILERTRNKSHSEAWMRQMLWDWQIFKQPTHDWWKLDVRVEQSPEYRMQTVKLLDMTSTALITTEKGPKRGQTSINPPGTVTRFPSHIFAPTQDFLPLKPMPDIRLPKKNLYIKFDSVYFLVDRRFLHDKDGKSVSNLPVARLFFNPDGDDFHCCPYLLIEIKPYQTLASYDYKMEKAVNYLVLHASTILHEWLKLLWLGAGAQEFEIRKDLEIHMFAAVSHTVRHLFCRIRPPKPFDGNRVRYEAVQGRDYDLTVERVRAEFNLMHQYIQASSHFYGNMYKEAICKALQSGINPDTTDSDDIYFAYSQRDGEIFYTMKHGDPGYVCYDETYRFYDEAGCQVIEGLDGTAAEHGLEAGDNLAPDTCQERTETMDVDQELSVCSIDE